MLIHKYLELFHARKYNRTIRCLHLDVELLKIRTANASPW